MKAIYEHEFEAAPGLPEPLPAGEKMLWQGTPQWFLLARDAFHVGKLALYFLLMIGLQLAFLIDDGAATNDIVSSIIKSLLTAALALGILCAVAWLASKTSLYSITNKRVIMRIGIVLTLTFNLPHKRIAGAAIKNLRGASGDIALALYPSDRIAWVHLWPHNRAWRFSQPEPAMRCIPNAKAVGELLLAAWREEHTNNERMAPDISANTTAAQPNTGTQTRQGLVA